MSIEILYKQEGGFAPFLAAVAGKRVAILYDVNTAPYAEEIREMLKGAGCLIANVPYFDEQLLPTEDKCAKAQMAANAAEYVLAVGSGTLNDMAKSVATRAGIPSGVLPTAASMDGYCSAGAALMREGFKVTDTVNPPAHVLVDADVIRTAPRIMTAAGFGDIVGKYTCLADWQLSHIINGEPIHKEAFAMMEQAREACMGAYEGLVRNESEAVEKLTSALLKAGLSMAMCGNSRPASGSEHHQSHFLEMDFARRGLPIPAHGVKVGLGTMLSLELYHHLSMAKVPCRAYQKVWALADTLPSPDDVRRLLAGVGCPVRFRDIGVTREQMRQMLAGAHTVRDRYTVLTLYAELGLTERLAEKLIDKYY
ncbi:MAG: sn-glycerol-1-phosphate dehydrogenase [Clostridia bacterium]|nr:sn-glycerol-1-phosphate dehydrogenase [Clostridia bacterium]